MSDNTKGHIKLRLGETLFHLNSKIVTALNSDFLAKLVDEDTVFQKPVNGVYTVMKADSMVFAVLLDLVYRSPGYGATRVVALQKEHGELLEAEADFWGIQDHIQKTLCLVNAAARVIQKRATMPTRRRSWGYLNITIIHCCVCGVRWCHLKSSRTCQIKTCPWRNINKSAPYAASNFFVCRPCGHNRRPDLAMSTLYCAQWHSTDTAPTHQPALRVLAFVVGKTVLDIGAAIDDCVLVKSHCACA